jgi:hypothetical protein
MTKRYLRLLTQAITAKQTGNTAKYNKIKSQLAADSRKEREGK